MNGLMNGILIRALALVAIAASAHGQPSHFDELGDTSKRKVVRGCPVDMVCDDSKSVLQEIHIKKKKKVPPAPVRPHEIRPDLPWLAQLQMPNIQFRWNERIIRYLEYYKTDPRGRSIMKSWLKRQGKYQQMLERTLRHAGLPTDLQYIAMIESGFNPTTVSRVGAVGLWQFMPAGGKIYGLKQTRWVDMRRDPISATRAAAAHMIDLYDRFGNWELALAAYNAGYGGVLRAIATFNTNDFWKLLEYENALPWGSSFYVAKGIAAAIVGNNRALFGYQVTPDANISTKTLRVKRSTSLKHIAKSLDIPLSQLQELNPHLRRGRTPPKQEFLINIPETTLLSEAHRQAVDQDVDYDTYTVKHGQRFEDIATQFGISRPRLRELNGIRHELQVRGGDVLLVPKVSAPKQKENKALAEENLYTSGYPKNLADEPLIVSVPDKDFRVEGAKEVFYRVVTGDSLFGIAKSFGIDRFALARYNGLHAEARIHPRMILRLFINPRLDLKKLNIKTLDPTRVLVVTRGSKEHLDLIEHRTGRKRIEVVAKKGDTLKSIGRKYGLSVYSLARINRFSPSTKLEPGQKVTVYKVVDTSRSDRAKKQKRKMPRARKRRTKKKSR